MNATCYHLRDMNGQKVLGGTPGMGATIDLNTAAARLVAEFDVAVLPSGRVSFMRNGKPVWAYLTVSPDGTAKAQAAPPPPAPPCRRSCSASIPQQYFAARQHRAAAQMRRPVVGQPAQMLLDGGYCLDSLI